MVGLRYLVDGDEVGGLIPQHGDELGGALGIVVDEDFVGGGGDHELVVADQAAGDPPCSFAWGGWVGGWMEKEKAVRMRCYKLGVGWMGEWVNGWFNE